MPTPTHKSATSVTLAPLAEKSPFEQLVERLWKPALAVAVLLSGWLVYRHTQQTKALARLDDEWTQLTAQAPLEGIPRVPTAAPAAFEALAQQLQASPAGPWARVLEAQANVKQRNYTAALASLEALKSQYPNHDLAKDAWPFKSGTEATFVEAWTQSIQQRASWESQHSNLFANPSASEGSPRVKISTERGDVVIVLYRDRAPMQVANFLDRLDKGLWKEAKFYRIDPQTGVDAGDPAATADPSAVEESGLYHFEGAVSAGPGTAPGQTSSHTFSILTTDHHELDGQRVVFGQVETGLDVVRQIAAADQKPEAPGEPAQPVSISAVELLAP
jgi:cyclophilin family peptidyl-prolyl cis-trans isomerase